eukprot:scaffold1970_cov396-Prasinococcus_capsulatus_cf.AAC.31
MMLALRRKADRRESYFHDFDRSPVNVQAHLAQAGSDIPTTRARGSRLNMDSIGLLHNTPR